MDIGGANLKAADGDGFAHSRPFPLWACPERLAEELRAIVAAAPACERLAVTMTGELADCFASKAEGVAFILDAVARAADGRDTRVYLTDGQFAPAEQARRAPLLAAASNWRALAEFARRWAGPAPAVLLDVGSTTTDIIPLLHGRVAAVGATDTARLRAGELVYAGVSRTPVCALVEEVPYRSSDCPVARELFATTRDVYLLLGDLPEAPHDLNTADHRPATQAAAQARLARMICADVDEFDEHDARRAAHAVAERHLEQTRVALQQVLAALPRPPATFLVSGEGEFFARRLLANAANEAAIVSLAEKLGPVASRCAPAYALAVLAREADL